MFDWRIVPLYTAIPHPFQHLRAYTSAYRTSHRLNQAGTGRRDSDISRRHYADYVYPRGRRTARQL